MKDKQLRVKQNPIGIQNIGDPFILRADGSYYIYATVFPPLMHEKGFLVWKSENLCDFDEPVVCYKMGERSFGDADYWAPEVVQVDENTFVMHYSARVRGTTTLRIGVAVSSSPLGPFVDVYDKKPMFDFGYAAIDGHVFTDEDGKRWFYYSKDCSENIIDGIHESHLYVAELSPDCLRLLQEPKFLFKPTLHYETMDEGNFRWNEGPFVLKRDNRYHIMYSANCYASSNYCICCASSSYPDRGFVKYDKPLLVSKDGFSGPGHNSVVTLDDGRLLCAYHVHTYADKPSYDRQLYFGFLHFVDGRLEFVGKDNT